MQFLVRFAARFLHDSPLDSCMILSSTPVRFLHDPPLFPAISGDNFSDFPAHLLVGDLCVAISVGVTSPVTILSCDDEWIEGIVGAFWEFSLN
ncbi:hypothetical protein TIFTF001_017038 [Ficus carica]|uniref:Uncharacterized protein n=1 Tax=Ficus carica TaxID=3494 RepID=A0AA88A1E8_FICCA|nr:hypothetical protein TIFTF001_017038 [Ficus carica]